MLVSWEWLSQYVELSVDADHLANRFAMTGLNHESTERVGDDIVIDLEVTSNRGDCLGHIGIAREASVILGQPLTIPAVGAASTGSGDSKPEPVGDWIRVENEFPAGCDRYTARVIRGVAIGPSPDWLVRRLRAIGLNSVNNVVDVTNYVMMECGQPLHAFDLSQVRGGAIVVRSGRPGETLEAIDHRTYQLDPGMVVIADAERALAIGGVMGGAGSEVSDATVDLLIESASFHSLAIRRAARLLKLHSPSSFRFERRPDPAGVDWASRRCCDLILETAGGRLCEGVAQAGVEPAERQPITLRIAQIRRILGIDIPADAIAGIPQALGCALVASAAGELTFVPPTWRADLTREVDLIEENARIHGYDRIPEDIAVPLRVARPRPRDIALDRIRHVLSAWGIDEALTASVVPDAMERHGSPWSDQPALETELPLLVGARHLRRSLIPSLLAARYLNQTQSLRDAELYEVATIYLPSSDAAALPKELSALGIVTRGDARFAKGVVEALVEQVAPRGSAVEWHPAEHAMFESGTLQQLTIDGVRLGFVGLIAAPVRDAIGLEQPVAAAELDVDALTDSLEQVRRAVPVSPYPAIARDLNFIVDEATPWSELSATCRGAADELLREVRYLETYRDAKRDGAGKKRQLLSLMFQSQDRTLTNEEVDGWVQRIVAACADRLSAKLIG